MSKQAKIVKLTPKFQAINPKKQELTVELIRQYPGMENISDKEAAKIILTIDTLSSILYELSKRMSKNGIILVDNQQVVKNTNKKAA